jgi:hypothetical protein
MQHITITTKTKIIALDKYILKSTIILNFKPDIKSIYIKNDIKYISIN